jgi:hypothetical protein
MGFVVDRVTVGLSTNKAESVTLSTRRTSVGEELECNMGHKLQRRPCLFHLTSLVVVKS